MTTLSDAFQIAFQQHQTGNLQQAEQLYHQILAVDPNCADALHLLGLLLHQQGQSEQALEFIGRAIGVDGDNAVFHSSRAVIYQDTNRLQEAISSYKQALQIQPDDAQDHFHLGLALREQGNPQEALHSFRQAYRLQPEDRLRVEMALTLPRIYQSSAEIAAWRKHLAESIDRLLQDRTSVDPVTDMAYTNFSLVYQGFNDREIQEKIGRLCHPAQNGKYQVGGFSQKSGKIRVGFVSKHFKNHTIGRLMRGLIAKLPRDTFDVVVFSAGQYNDAVAQSIRQQADTYVEIPSDLNEVGGLIRQQQPEVLFYPDIGMDTLTYGLAQLRLAPVQCVSWGHPVTTGLPTIDYFISSELFEPEHAQSHYTETLVKLKGINTYYHRPELPADLKPRAYFGLGDDEHIYLCPQTLFKFHPDFDPILAGILRRDPQGKLVLIKGRHPNWDKLLLRRFRNTLPDVVERVQFVPPHAPPDFLNLLALANVMLDTVHFGGGNTSLEGLAVGTPIVTLPSQFLRGRLTFGFYRRMGVMDCVAATPQNYIDLAVKLGSNPAYRQKVSAKILAANHVLFEDDLVVNEFAGFLKQAVKRTEAKL